jgi:RND superfamily putative drug exporter
VISPPARTIVRFRYLVILFWIVVAVLALPKAASVHEVLEVEGETLIGSDSRTASDLMQREFPRPIKEYFAVTVKGPFPVDSAPYTALLDSLTRVAAAQPYITRVLSHLTTPDEQEFLVSEDRLTTFFVAAAQPNETGSATDWVPDFRQIIHGTLQRIPWASDYEVNVTGGPALDYDIRTVSKEDTEKGEKKSLPFSAVVLVLAFGALVAALLPLLVGVFAIECSLALVYVASDFYPMSVFVLTIVSMVGLGVGIDYSLLIVTRFREELNRGHGPREAARRTVTTAGRAVITSGLTVLLGFAGLLITPISETRSIGIGGLFVVAAAVLLSVTLLPAVLSIIGRGIDRPRWLARRLRWYHAPTGWERWARWLGHHPWRALVIGGACIAAITWPLANIEIGLPRSGWFPSGTESHAGVQALEGIGARGALQPVRLVIRAPGGENILSSRYLRGLRRFSDSIKTDPRVTQVRGPVDIEPGMSMLRYTMLYSDLDAARARAPEFYSAYLSSDNRTILMDVLLADSVSLTNSMQVVRDIRAMVEGGIRGLSGVQVYTGGFQSGSVDLQDRLLEQFPSIIAFILIATALMMFIAFQSILVPIKAVIMNCLSVAGAFGLTVLVFQQGVGGRLFGLEEPTGAIYVVVPVVVFAVVFGLSMDYEVFLLSRIKEAFDRTGRNDQATMEGLTATASVITSAAAIMIIVFGTFSFSNVLPAQQLGFGLAMAVLLDATIIRMVLVPAVMHIAGRWNWWPGVRGRPDAPEPEAASETSGEPEAQPEAPPTSTPAPDAHP